MRADQMPVNSHRDGEPADSSGSDFDAMVMRNDVDQLVREMCYFWNTYKDQQHYKTFQRKTIIEDMLYSVGIAMNPNYRFAEGYRKFKEDLRAYLDA
jgi:hypothetical protein